MLNGQLLLEYLGKELKDVNPTQLPLGTSVAHKHSYTLKLAIQTQQAYHHLFELSVLFFVCLFVFKSKISS